MMLEDVFNGLLDQAKSLDITAHLESDIAKATAEEAQSATRDSVDGAYRTMLKDGVAVISASGPLMKHASSMGGGASSVLLRQSINAAAKDPRVGAILLSIESPGGTSAGTYELASTIKRANEVKPVLAHIEDLGASAAYWLAAAASSISANLPAMVGSIGTYMVVSDLSAMAAKEGVKVHVIRAGQYKGMGTPGTEITADQLAILQDRVDSANELFLAGVMEGRKMDREQLNKIADGRVYSAAKAKDLGLIDRVQTFDEAFNQAVALAAKTLSPKGLKMSENTPAPQAATISQVRAACPGITADKIVSYVESGKTLEQCKDAWMQEIATELAAKEEALAKVEAEKAEAIAKAEVAAKAPGVDPISEETQATSTNADAKAEWNEKVAEKMKSGCDRAKAMVKVAAENPGLRERAFNVPSRN